MGPGGKRKKDKNDRSLETMSDEQVPSQDVSSSCNNVLREDGEPSRKHFRVVADDHKLLHSRKQGRRLLRPSKVPKAPQNSTQFIIDDHENSAYFIDFENVYRTTREAEIIEWTHEVLVDKISSLEERVKTLEQQLLMCDPAAYTPQHRIVCMRDENRQVKEFRVWCPMHGKKVRLRNVASESSSDEDSSSSSDSQVQNGDSDSDSDSDEPEETLTNIKVNSEKAHSSEDASEGV